MRNLTFDDLLLGLKDLLETKSADLDRSVAGKIYRPLLAAKRADIENLPENVRRGLPLTQELAEADATHDAIGAAIYHVTEAIRLHPAIDEATKESAARAQQTFMPALGILKARYADEAALAHRKRPVFEATRADYDAVMVPGGSSLAEWIHGFLEEGDRIGELLHGRAEAGIGLEASTAGGALRSSAIGLLGRFRQAVRDEVESGASLPKDYEARLFAFIDQLDRTRADAVKRRAKPKVDEKDLDDAKPSEAPPACD